MAIRKIVSLGKRPFLFIALMALGFSAPAFAGDWKPISSGGNSVNISGGQVCVDSSGPGKGYAVRARPYGFSQDYTVSFDFKLGTENNHWLILYYDEFIYVGVDTGTGLKLFGQGPNSPVLKNLAPGKWNRIKIEAHPGLKSYDLFVDGQKLGAATNLLPGERVIGAPTYQDVNKAGIMIGEFERGEFNFGSGCWKNIELPSDQGLAWETKFTGGNNVNISGEQVCIDAMQPGVGFATRPRAHDISKDYTVSFEFKINTDNNHLLIIYYDEFAYVGIEWKTDLKLLQQGELYTNTQTLAKMEPDKWYQFRIEAHPGQKSYDLFLDGQKLGAATNLEPGMRVPGAPSYEDVAVGGFLIGDFEPAAKNRGNACWRNFKFGAGAGPSK